jgi:hypothetical protein
MEDNSIQHTKEKKMDTNERNMNENEPLYLALEPLHAQMML